MTNQRETLHSGGVGQDHGPGSGPGPGREPARGHGQASGRGRGRSPGHGKASGHGGGKGRGRGRASNAIYRSENSSSSSADGKLVGDFAPGCAHGAGFRSNQPGKQPSLSEIHELLVGRRSFGRGYIPKNKGARPTPLAFGNSMRRGRLSWADMRRQSQHSNSTADDSSEPDRSQRGFRNVGGCDGGWGGRGRGRLLDSSSVKKFGSSAVNVDTSSFGGRGRGGILYVPGVNFHSGLGATWWKSSGTSNQRVLSLRHSVGGCATNSAVQSSQSFQRNETGTGHSSNKQQKQKRQIWKKKTKCKENNNGVNIDNLKPVNGSEKGDSHTQGSFVSCIQRKEEASVRNIENTEEESSNGSETVTGANKQVIDIISLAEGNDEKQSDVSDLEENLQKQLNIGTDSVIANMQKSVVPVICSTEQKEDRKDYWKPMLSSPRRGCTRGIVLFGANVIIDGGTADTQSEVTCERGIEDKPSDTQIILKSKNNNDQVCGAVV